MRGVRIRFVGARDRREVVLVGQIDQLVPSGVDFRFHLCDLAQEASPVRLSASQCVELFDLETGEIVAAPAAWLRDRWIAAQVTIHGGVPLAAAIDGLPIEGIGPEMSDALARTFGTWAEFWPTLIAARAEVGQQNSVDGWYDGPALGRLSAVDGVGPTALGRLIEGCADPAVLDYVAVVQAAGILPSTAHGPVADGRFSGRCFVITGTFEALTRDALKAAIEREGGKVAANVSQRTDFLVVGSNPGSKFDRAEELGIPYVTEATIREYLGI